MMAQSMATVRAMPGESLDMSSGHSCMICLVEFTSTEEDHIPRVLTCGHTFCTGCLERMVKQCGIMCPTCKADTPLVPAGPQDFLSRQIGVDYRQRVQRLPKNYGLLDLLGSLTIAPEPAVASRVEQPGPAAGELENDARRADLAWCDEHDEQMKVFCRDDRKLICIYCQIHGRHKGHNCTLLGQVAGEERASLQQWITQLTNRRKELTTSLDGLRKRSAALKGNEEAVRKAIDTHTNMVVEAFQQRREELCRQVSEQAKGKRDRLGKQECAVQHILSLVEGAIDSCRSSLQVSDAELVTGVGDATLASSRACKARCRLTPIDETNLDCHWSNTGLLWDILAEYGRIEEVATAPDCLSAEMPSSIAERVVAQMINAASPVIHNEEPQSEDEPGDHDSGQSASSSSCHSEDGGGYDQHVNSVLLDDAVQLDEFVPDRNGQEALVLPLLGTQEPECFMPDTDDREEPVAGGSCFDIQALTDERQVYPGLGVRPGRTEMVCSRLSPIPFAARNKREHNFRSSNEDQRAVLVDTSVEIMSSTPSHEEVPSLHDSSVIRPIPRYPWAYEQPPPAVQLRSLRPQILPCDRVMGADPSPNDNPRERLGYLPQPERRTSPPPCIVQPPDFPPGIQRIGRSGSSSGKRRDLRALRPSQSVREQPRRRQLGLATRNSVATVAAGDLLPQRWQCNFCTLVNKGDAKVCVACAKTRGTKDKMEDPGPPNSIPCPKCTLLNDPDRHIKCVACGCALRESSDGENSQEEIQPADDNIVRLHEFFEAEELVREPAQVTQRAPQHALDEDLFMDD